jgi:hypothetical protein
MMFLTAVMVVLTAVMVLLTGIYVYYTKRIVLANRTMLDEVREQAWLANRAYIVVRLAFRQRFHLTLEIANEGKSPAQGLKLSLDRDVYQGGDKSKRINDMPMFSESYETVPPGGRYFLYLWPGTVVLGTELFPKEFKVTASYKSLGRPVREDTMLHPLLYAEFPSLAIEESVEKVPGALEGMKNSLEKIVFRFDQFLRYGK